MVNMLENNKSLIRNKNWKKQKKNRKKAQKKQLKEKCINAG